jgi:hypothetical protein
MPRIPRPSDSLQVDGAQGADTDTNTGTDTSPDTDSNVIEVEFNTHPSYGREVLRGTDDPLDAPEFTEKVTSIYQEVIEVSERVGLPPLVRFIKGVAEDALAKGNTTLVLGVGDMEVLFEWLGYPLTTEGRRTR